MNKLQTHNRLFLRQNCAFIRSFYGREGLPIFLKKQKTFLSKTLKEQGFALLYSFKLLGKTGELFRQLECLVGLPQN